jgi:hypothetical protein
VIPIEEDDMASAVMSIEEPAEVRAEPATIETTHAYRLRPIMRQGTASSIPETWTRYTTLDEARRAVKQMYHDDRVLRVFVVTDEAPPRFVEWMER